MAVPLAPNALALKSLCADSLAIGGEKCKHSFSISSDHRSEIENPSIDLEGSLAKILNDTHPVKSVKDDWTLPDVAKKYRSTAMPRPKLMRGFTIGTTGFNKVLNDIHSSNQLDLHSIITTPAKKQEPPTLDKEGSFQLVLAKLMKEHRENKAEASTPVETAPRLGMAKQWAVLRGASMVLALKAVVALQKYVVAPSETQQLAVHAQSTDSVDVGEWTEQAWFQQVQAGMLNNLFTTMHHNAHIDPNQMYLFHHHYQQQHLWIQQQQQYLWMQQQQQQQQQETQQYEWYCMQMQMVEMEAQMHMNAQQQQQQQQIQPVSPFSHSVLPATMVQTSLLGPSIMGAPTLALEPLVIPLSPMQAQPVQAKLIQAQLMQPSQYWQQMGPSPTALTWQPLHGTVSYGRLAEMAFTQEGSKQLQEDLHRMPPTKLQEACDELAPAIGDLCTHTFGNYLVSSLCSLPQAQPAIIAALTGHIVELAAHVQGSRVVQSALSALTATIACTLVAELAGHVAQVAKQTCGSWTICSAYRTSHADFILREVAADIGQLSILQDGSRVVQRILPEAVSHGADFTPVLDALITKGPALANLAEDAFGNYVVQQVFTHTCVFTHAHVVCCIT